MSNDFSQLTAVIVDDSDFMRRTVEAMLEALGVGRIFHAKDANDGYTMICDCEPDFVISDWDMVPGDGLQLVEWVRNRPDSPDRYLPFIMLTGYSERNRVVIARDKGVTEFLAKPVAPKDLLSRLVSIVEEPRPFIRSDNFFGPDRRRRDEESYSGPERRDDMAFLI